jgi:hypothetical protein
MNRTMLFAAVFILLVVSPPLVETRLSLFGRVLLPVRSSADTDLQDLLVNSDSQEQESSPEHTGEEMPEWVPEPQKSSFDEDNWCWRWGYFIQNEYLDFTCCEGVRPNHELVEREACLRWSRPGCRDAALPEFHLAVCTYCGDGICGPLECKAWWNCPEDCLVFPRPFCGDGMCGWFESFLTCPEDCYNYHKRSIRNKYYCGDGDCDKGERVSCPEDCFEEVGGMAVEDGVVEQDGSQPKNREPGLLSLISRLLGRRSS